MANIFKSKFTGEHIEEILDKANNVTDVQANNGEPTTADLSTLKIGDVNYKIPEPSAPETPIIVEANPSGDATAELSKLKVGETIYSIPQNSGGGGTQLYKHTVVCSNATVIIISTVGTQATSAIDFESSIPSLHAHHTTLAFYGNLLISSYRDGDTPSAIRNQKIYGSYIDVSGAPRVIDFGTFVSDTVTPV